VSSGFLLIDKPSGLTSHDVVSKVRKALGTKKVGHAGTLDPMATGLLVIGFNQGTKLLTFAVGKDKTYLATIRLGSSTVTDDSEGEVTFKAEPARLHEISKQEIQREIKALTGEIDQVPSSVSAIKVSGVRSYDRVRSGEEFVLPARKVTVSRFELLEISTGKEFIDLEVAVDCSSGTYIRALARDLGKALGVGGHLTKLRRTRVGNLQVSEATGLEALQLGDFQKLTLFESCQEILPMIEITPQEAIDLKQGKQIRGVVSQETGASTSEELVAVVTQARDGWLRSLVVFEEAKSD